jgi:ABC-type oligopeptide transport system ATPase subunit
MTKIINLLGGPCSGKSTTAAGLFYRLKLSGHKVELVTEYAKDLTYEKRHMTLENQIYVFAKQLHRIERVKDQVDYVITDSPILLSCIYVKKDLPESFEQLVIDMWNRDDNLIFYMNRPKTYQEYGRHHTYEQAVQIDGFTKLFMEKHNLDYSVIESNPTAPIEIMKKLGLYRERAYRD